MALGLTANMLRLVALHAGIQIVDLQLPMPIGQVDAVIVRQDHRLHRIEALRERVKVEVERRRHREGVQLVIDCLFFGFVDRNTNSSQQSRLVIYNSAEWY